MPPAPTGVRAERAFEAALRQSRYALRIAVVVLLWLAMRPVTTVDVAHVLARIGARILVANLLQLSLEVSYTTVSGLLYLAAGVLLVGGATYLTSLTDRLVTRQLRRT